MESIKVTSIKANSFTYIRGTTRGIGQLEYIPGLNGFLLAVGFLGTGGHPRS